MREPPRDVTPITPNEDFYMTSYRTPPFLRAETWSLSLHGQVRTPFTLTYAELVNRPAVSEIVTLECVGNGVAGEAIGTAEWKGVPLKTLLDEAGVQSTAFDVVLRAADGYSDSLPVERAMVGDVLVAYQMNGVPLPLGHGFPVRIIVPGVYGMKHVQWLTEITLVPHDYRGYYQQKGWSDEATVKTMSWISDPQEGDTLQHGMTTAIKGLAFAGTRRIRQVEISTDGGKTWIAATMKTELSESPRRFWSYEWEPVRLGDDRILARAIDGTGQVQTTTEQKPFPDGASGLHEVIVSVE